LNLCLCLPVQAGSSKSGAVTPACNADIRSLHLRFEKKMACNQKGTSFWLQAINFIVVKKIKTV
jgi:hypothetical protein